LAATRNYVVNPVRPRLGTSSRSGCFFLLCRQKQSCV
jgi:hypothetical protein